MSPVALPAQSRQVAPRSLHGLAHGGGDGGGGHFRLAWGGAAGDAVACADASAAPRRGSRPRRHRHLRVAGDVGAPRLAPRRMDVSTPSGTGLRLYHPTPPIEAQGVPPPCEPLGPPRPTASPAASVETKDGVMVAEQFSWQRCCSSPPQELGLASAAVGRLERREFDPTFMAKLAALASGGGGGPPSTHAVVATAWAFHSVWVGRAKPSAPLAFGRASGVGTAARTVPSRSSGIRSCHVTRMFTRDSLCSTDRGKGMQAHTGEP